MKKRRIHLFMILWFAHRFVSSVSRKSLCWCRSAGSTCGRGALRARRGARGERARAADRLRQVVADGLAVALVELLGPVVGAPLRAHVVARRVPGEGRPGRAPPGPGVARGGGGGARAARAGPPAAGRRARNEPFRTEGATRPSAGRGATHVCTYSLGAKSRWLFWSKPLFSISSRTSMAFALISLFHPSSSAMIFGDSIVAGRPSAAQGARGGPRGHARASPASPTPLVAVASAGVSLFVCQRRREARWSLDSAELSRTRVRSPPEGADHQAYTSHGIHQHSSRIAGA